MTSRNVTDPDSGGARSADRHIGTVGTLSIWIPQTAWRQLSDQLWPHPPELADQVHHYVRTTLVGEANRLMGGICPGAGAAFIPDPRPDCDRHGLTVHGLLNVYAPQVWGQMLVHGIDGPRSPSDVEIAEDLDAFTHETLVEVFDTTLATLCVGAVVWFCSEPGDQPW